MGESLDVAIEPNLWRDIRAWYVRNNLLLGFCIATVLALAWPAPGQVLYAPAVRGVHVLPFTAVAMVFFISGLNLKTDELKSAFTRRAAVGTIFGVVSILGVTPLLGFGIRLIPLQPVEYIIGIVVMAVVPTSMGVGIALATSAKANIGLAIFLTVVTNVIGIALMPLWLKAMLSTPGSPLHSSNNASSSSSKALSASISINLADMFVKLLLSNLAPTVAGKLLRDFSPTARSWVTSHPTTLALTASSFLSLLTGLSLSCARDQIVDTSFGTMLLVLLISGMQHIIYLAFNTLCMKLLKVGLPEAVSTILLASQKAPPVAFTVITYMTTDPVAQGLLAVPSIAGGLLSVVIDQPLVNHYAREITRWQAQLASSQQRLPVLDLTAYVPDLQADIQADHEHCSDDVAAKEDRSTDVRKAGAGASKGGIRNGQG